MSSESEPEQYEMDAESEEEQSEKSASEEEQVDNSESEGEDGEDEGDEKPGSKNKENNSNEHTHWTHSLLEIYSNLYGRCLQVHFVNKVLNLHFLEEIVNDRCKLVSGVHSYGTKSDPDCFVVFDNSESRIKGMRELNNMKINGNALRFEVPKWENPHNGALFVVKKATEKLIEVEDSIPCRLLVQNIPAESSLPDIEKVFPQAIRIKVNIRKYYNTLTAVVTMPSEKDAREAKNKQCRIGENNLKVHLLREQSFAAKSLRKNGPYFRGIKRKLEDRSNVFLTKR